MVSIKVEENRIAEEFRRQTYEAKELIPIPEEDRMAEALWHRASAANALLIHLSNSDHYGPSFLEDMAMAFFYSDAAMVTRLCHFHGDGDLANPGKQFRWVEEVVPGSLMVDPTKVGRLEAMAHWHGRSLITSRNCLSLDEFNYLENMREGQNASLFDV